LVDLEEGESMVLQDSAKEDNLGKGTLYLTTKRIVFERKKGLPVDIPVNYVSAVSAETKRLVVEGRESETATLTVLSFDVKEAQKWASSVKEKANP